MNNGHTHVLLIEDNPGDADLVRLRLVEATRISQSPVPRAYPPDWPRWRWKHPPWSCST